MLQTDKVAHIAIMEVMGIRTEAWHKDTADRK